MYGKIMHQARKRFGQNFLQDSSIIQAIIQNIHPNQADNMLEIGPGLGALTTPLLKCLNKLTAVELDRDLIAKFKSNPAFNALTLVEGDALKVDYATFGDNLRVVGNLPYNISTPLILHLLKYHHTIKDMHFMLQKEVVERLAASPNSKDYGRLSIMVQYWCDVEALFVVPPTAFLPAPKVDSQIVRLIPHKTPKYPDVQQAVFEKVVAQAFSMRRKTIYNTLKSILSLQEIKDLQIDPGARAETLSIDVYVRLAQYLSDKK